MFMFKYGMPIEKIAGGTGVLTCAGAGLASRLPFSENRKQKPHYATT
jgi:hypothetical protein